jgi:hypothetical protein
VIPIGSLVRDVDVGDIGLIIGPLVERKTMVNPIKAIQPHQTWCKIHQKKKAHEDYLAGAPP